MGNLEPSDYIDLNFSGQSFEGTGIVFFSDSNLWCDLKGANTLYL